MKTSKFEKELSDLLNRYSKENGSDTPDFILAQYVQGCLDNLDRTMKDRDWWYGKDETPSTSHVKE